MGRDRAFSLTVVALAILLVILHVLAAGPLRDSWWGLHAYAFLPPVWLWLGIAAVAGSLVLLAPRFAPEVAPATTPARRPWLWPAGLALTGLVGFWLLRIRHVFLGDASVMVVNVAQGEAFHPRAPLSAVIQQQVYRLGAALGLGGGDLPLRDQVREALAPGSVMAGALFLPVAWWLAGELIWGEGDTAPGWRRRLPVFLILAGQGFLLLFCGYVEHYTLVTLALAIVLWLGLRALRTGGSLLPVLGASVVALGLHLSAAVLLPGLMVLVVARLADPARRRRTLVELGLGAVLLVILGGLAALLAPGYDLAGTLAEAARSAVTRDQEQDRDYLFGARHLRDLFNEQALIGSLAAFLFVPALVVGTVRRRWRATPVLFLAVTGLTYLVVSILAGESNLGYPRNWDLLAPGGLVLVTAGLGLFLAARREMPAPAILWVAVAVSWFHTAPWLALNTSFDRSFARMQSLPSVGGLNETNVARWYLLLGDTAESVVWLDKALAVNPANNNAWYLKGTILEGEGDWAGAAEAYGQAVRFRSYKTEYREKHLLSLVASGQWAEAVTAGRELADHEGVGPASRTFYAMALVETGHTDEAEPVLAELQAALGADSVERATLGRYFASRGDRARQAGESSAAAEQYSAALTWIPGEPAVWLRYVQALRDSGEPGRAAAAGQRALANWPDWPDMLAVTGLLLRDLGHPDEAAQMLERALAQAPDEVWAARLREQMGP